MGRPTKLTPELQAKLCGLLREGKFFRHACNACGVDENTVNGWLSKAKEPGASQELIDFSVACVRARDEGEQRLIENMRTMAIEKLDWKQEAWILERMNPKQYHLTTKSEISGPEGGAIQISGPTIMVPPESDD